MKRTNHRKKEKEEGISMECEYCPFKYRCDGEHCVIKEGQPLERIKSEPLGFMNNDK